VHREKSKKEQKGSWTHRASALGKGLRPNCGKGGTGKKKIRKPCGQRRVSVLENVKKRKGLRRLS